MPLTDPAFYFFASLALIVVGISKGGFGGGLGVINVPLMSLAISPIQAAAIALPILCVMDLFGLYVFRGRWDRQTLTLAITGAVFGVVLGGLTFQYLSVSHLRLMLGVIALVFALQFWLGGGQSPVVRQESSAIRGLFWSGLSGFTSTTAHAGGPPLDAWLLRLGLDKTVYQATTVAYYTVINYLKLIPYFLLGQFTLTNLSTSAVLLPIAVCGMVAGIRLHDRIPVRRFYQVCYTMLTLVGIKLIVDGLS